MFLVSREFSFCYAHRLQNYDGKCRQLHGHNGRVRITLAAESLNQCGMVRDFSDLKKRIGDLIDQNFDHRTILAATDPLADILENQGEPVVRIAENPTAEHLAHLIFQQIDAEGFPIESVEFWETDPCCATFRR